MKPLITLVSIFLQTRAVSGEQGCGVSSPLPPQNAWKELLARTEQFRYLFSVPATNLLTGGGVPRLVLLGCTGSAQCRWEHRPSPRSSAHLPHRAWGRRAPCPYTFKGYYGYFYHRFLKSHFSGCSVCAEKHHSPGEKPTPGHLFSQPGPARSQGRQRLARILGTRRGSLLRGREGKN